MNETTNAAALSADEQFLRGWTRPSIRVGIITVVATMIASFLPNLYLYLAYGVFPSWHHALAAWGQVALAFGAFYVVEPMSYYPIFGMTGTYIGVLSGNIANVRLPAAATAQEVVGVENGTKKGELISTLGICGSVITNLVFLTIAVVLGDSILGLLPGFIRNALSNFILPSLFGAMYGQFAYKNPKIALYAMPLSLLFLGLTGIPAWGVIIIAVFGNILITYLLYKRKLIQ
ncbi:hypothetical protein [Anaerotruncus sp. DFI.9.16]|uniref:hypothetical protein n=1 Tax=Anaerotruncus sp. DFI.9.16 TaxID=2965275 RepID=UPI00210E3EDB|nr:hypothetical protein [Anaerotruncus sp. DFI.9.16]MCQ4895635.1 hypothetical protein [Anaerotruncus sp. DFI.9.16]